MISELIAAVYESSAKTGQPIDPPLLIVLDEAANIAPLPDLDVLASSGAGQGIQLLTVFQDLAQVQARYGRRAQTIVNNHRAKVFASGIGDPDTLRYVTQVIGAGEFRQRSETAAEQGRSSATEGTTYRDLAPPNIVRGAKPGSALAVYGHLAPARIELRPWFRDPALRKLAEGSADDGA
jgi:type IV secretion system protein VirD4